MMLEISRLPSSHGLRHNSIEAFLVAQITADPQDFRSPSGLMQPDKQITVVGRRAVGDGSRPQT